jgi:ABC-type methionine transport system permease subunit
MRVDRCVIDAATAMAAKPKHIVTAWIAIRGLPPDNGGEQCFGR